jgi:hypothetical protein
LGHQLYYNPHGLWISCGLSWQSFVGNTPSQWSLGTFIYEITLSDSVLKISNIKELKGFIKKYKYPNNKLKINNIINWTLVKKDYDGLLICPYLGNKIWGKHANMMGLYGNFEAINNYIEGIVGKRWKTKLYFLAEWYRHWETSTGVIWKTTGIKKLILIKKLGTFDKN